MRCEDGWVLWELFLLLKYCSLSGLFIGFWGACAYVVYFPFSSSLTLEAARVGRADGFVCKHCIHVCARNWAGAAFPGERRAIFLAHRCLLSAKPCVPNTQRNVPYWVFFFFFFCLAGAPFSKSHKGSLYGPIVAWFPGSVGRRWAPSHLQFHGQLRACFWSPEDPPDHSCSLIASGRSGVGTVATSSSDPCCQAKEFWGWGSGLLGHLPSLGGLLSMAVALLEWAGLSVQVKACCGLGSGLVRVLLCCPGQPCCRSCSQSQGLHQPELRAPSTLGSSLLALPTSQLGFPIPWGGSLAGWLACPLSWWLLTSILWTSLGMTLGKSGVQIVFLHCKCWFLTIQRFTRLSYISSGRWWRYCSGGVCESD